MDSLAFSLIHRFNMGDSLRRSAKRYPAKVAVRFEGADTSYAALDAKADKVARFFLDRGIARGDAVAFLGLNSVSFLAHFFGLARIGAPFVPINALLRGKEVDYVLSRANVKALVIDPMLSGSLDPGSEALSCIGHKFALGSGPAPEGFELMEPMLQGVLDDPVECLVENEDPATILFTSGTTAFPKAVMNTHLNYYASFLAAVTDIGITKEDRPLLCLPLFHSAGLFLAFGAITPGYLGDQEATEELFMGGWHHTGDMGFKGEGGFLYFVDRKKDMIKSGGENVASQEVEEVLSAHPKVAEVAVIGMADPYWVEKVVAVIKTKASETLTQDEVVVFAKTRLASFKAPKEVYFVEDLPRSPSGKVLKRAMKDEIVRQVKKEA
jgi:acyl-CoA synthetase (AMP-forming)/AMP-acid ligase II